MNFDKHFFKQLTAFYLLKENGTNYLTTFIPPNGDGITIGRELKDVFVEFGINPECIKCDSTNVNVGCKAGINATLETLLNESKHWGICAKHFVELILKSQYEHIFGEPSGLIRSISTSLL